MTDVGERNVKIKVGKQSGRVYIEIGEDFLVMTPEEARRVLAGLMGVVPDVTPVLADMPIGGAK